MAVRKAIDDGAIGEVEMADDRLARPDRRRWTISGGPAALSRDMTIHDFDMARFRYEELIRVSAHASVLRTAGSARWATTIRSASTL